MTRFLPAWIFLISVPAYGGGAVSLGSRASFSGFQIGILGVKEDRTRREKVARGTRWCFDTKRGTRVTSPRVAHNGAARGPTLKRADRPLAFHFVFFSPFSLFGPHFAPAASFAHISRSRTPIDDPSATTCHTSKHFPILTILFSFERLECAALVILFFMSFCSFLAIQDSN